MVPVNFDDLTRRFPRASASFLKANLPPDCAGQIAKSEPAVRPVPLAAGQTQETDSSRFLVCVTSVRKRLLDEDNLCAKFHVDLCRYSGALPVDSPERCQIHVSQRKAEKGEEEKTEITVYQL